MDAYNEGERNEVILAGTITAAIYNVNNSKLPKPLTWRDIFPEAPKPRDEKAMVADLLLKANMLAAEFKKR